MAKSQWIKFSNKEYVLDRRKYTFIITHEWGMGNYLQVFDRTKIGSRNRLVDYIDGFGSIAEGKRVAENWRFRKSKGDHQ